MTRFLRALAPIWKPHAGQREVLLARARTLVLACGRRWGKTEAAAVRLLYALTRPAPLRAILVAPTLDQAHLLFERVVELLTHARESCGLFADGEPKVRLRPHPELRMSGHLLAARSGHVGRNLRGRGADEIVVDEAAFVEESLIEDVLFPMLATTHGRMTLLSTPNGFNHFFRYFGRGQSGEADVWSRTAPSAENPAVSAEFLAARRASSPARTFRREFEAAFESVSGSVFSGEVLERAALPPDAPPAEGPVCLGIDFGRHRDHTAVVAVRGTRHRASVERATRIESGPWRDQLPRIERILREFPHGLVHCDATGGGSGISERLQGEYPQRVRLVTFSAPVKAALVNGLVALFEEGRLGLRPDPLLREELDAYVAVETPSGHVRTEAARGHDDLVMALALAVKGLEAGFVRPLSA